MNAAIADEPDSAAPRLRAGDALLIVDVQNDFLPGGSLGVAGGDAVIAPLNHCIARFAELGLPVFASRDWHPADHCSFHGAGGPWPPHCIADSPGALFAASLQLPPQTFVVSKGTTRDRDDYSAFSHTELHTRLGDERVQRLFVGGLATDYCVRATVLDALALGYRVVALRNAVAAVDAQPGDGARALRRMQASGAVLAASDDLR